MSRGEIETRTMELIQKTIGDPNCKVSLEMNFMEDMDITSLEMFSLLTDMEEAFDIQFEPEDILDVVTIGDLVDCIEKKCA